MHVLSQVEDANVKNVSTSRLGESSSAEDSASKSAETQGSLLSAVTKIPACLCKKLSAAVELWRDEQYRWLELLSVFTSYVPQKVFSFKPRYLITGDDLSRYFGKQPAVAVRLATVADVPALVSLHNKPREFARRFGNNHLCVVAEAGGGIVGYEWFHADASHYEPDLDYWFYRGPNTIWFYDAYVAPAFRQKGVWRAIQAGAVAILGDSRSFCAIVDFTNYPALKAYLRHGFRIARQSFHVCLMGVRFVRKNTLSKAALFKLYRKLSLPFCFAVSSSRWKARRVA